MGARWLMRWIVMAGSMALHITAQAGLEQTVIAAKPSLVAVGSFDALASPRFQFRGTGFAVTDGRHIVTCAHVIARPPNTDVAPRWMVAVPRARQAPELRTATVLATDTEHDLAVLVIEGEPLPALKLAGAGVAREGRDIALIGFPLGSALGLAPVTHRGIVSAISPVAIPSATARQLDPRVANSLRNGSFDILQLDATAYPGNSGGPVLDIDSGSVVGIVNMVLIKGTKESALSQPTGITYAIPSELAIPLTVMRTAETPR